MVLLVGSMDKALRYPLAMDSGLTILTSTLPLPVMGGGGIGSKRECTCLSGQNSGQFREMLVDGISIDGCRYIYPLVGLIVDGQ